ncbi:transglutaminase-like domain-containing protein [Microbulbifer aggregans]|uniref:transglutaminase-like domain-containing protein n=1 Tax=Microbulbifer aggregans TaxID=1769779 RepID=UPI001CFDD6D0|nr:transglutaminase-like domain-containing protein [Microbulbifer aggregans]
MRINFPMSLQVSICAAIVLPLLIVSFLWAGNSDTIQYNTNKVVRYSFLVTNKTGSLIEQAQFSVFAPVAQNSYQKTQSISASHKYEVTQDGQGNQTLNFELVDMAPFSSQVVSVTVQMALAGTPQSYSATGDFLESEPNIEVDSPVVVELAKEIRRNTNVPNQISSWLYKNVVDIGYVAEDRGARYALLEKKGDCTEFSSAFVALSRAVDIPARMIGGFVIEDSGKLSSESYHNWAEYKYADRWKIADPQKNIVDSGYGSYIAFYNFNKHSRVKSSHRFLSFDTRLSVQML